MLINTPIGPVEVPDIVDGHIENIANIAHLCPNIEKVVVYVEENCTIDSQIGISFYSSMDEKEFWDSDEFQEFIDELVSYDVDQDYNVQYGIEIGGNGIVVYDKDKL